MRKKKRKEKKMKNEKKLEKFISIEGDEIHLLPENENPLINIKTKEIN